MEQFTQLTEDRGLYKKILKEGYDKEGFNKQGYDRQGYDQEGFNKQGYNRLGHKKYTGSLIRCNYLYDKKIQY
jgi:hypothetical protein